ncbi:MAG: cupin domain-containing protein [Actinomycetota bacterium]
MSTTTPTVLTFGDLDLRGPSGAVWGLDSEQLNANLVVVREGDTLPEHVNGEVDVLMVVTGGRGSVTVDGAPVDIADDTLVLIPRGARRSVSATTTLSYLTIHVRRSGLDISATTRD